MRGMRLRGGAAISSREDLRNFCWPKVTDNPPYGQRGDELENNECCLARPRGGESKDALLNAIAHRRARRTPMRRWLRTLGWKSLLRFRLRSLLILIAFAAVLLAWLSDR